MPSPARTKALVEIIMAAKLGLLTTTGNIWYVDSGNSAAANQNGAGRSVDTPFSTLAYAVLAANQSASGVVANNGDVIVVCPGHTETVAAAGTVTCDIAGLTILGMGSGSDRPTFNFTATGSTFVVSGANTTLYNLLLTGGVDAVVSAIVISGADCKVLQCEGRDVTGQMTGFILTTAAANRLLIDGLKFNGAIAAGGDTCVHLVGGDGIEIKNSTFFGNWGAGCIFQDTTTTTNINIHDCTIQNGLDTATVDAVVCVSLTAASTGFVGPNIQCRLGVDATSNVANITGAVVGAAAQFILPINVCNLGGEATMVWNGTASTDA